MTGQRKRRNQEDFLDVSPSQVNNSQLFEMEIMHDLDWNEVLCSGRGTRSPLLDAGILLYSTRSDSMRGKGKGKGKHDYRN